MEAVWCRERSVHRLWSQSHLCSLVLVLPICAVPQALVNLYSFFFYFPWKEDKSDLCLFLQVPWFSSQNHTLWFAASLSHLFTKDHPKIRHGRYTVVDNLAEATSINWSISLGISHNMWGNEVLGGGLRSPGALLVGECYTLQRQRDNSWA